MTQSTHAVEVTTDSFHQEVLEKSREMPVLVDFWADWCNPCKMLNPILASLASEYEGRFQLTKIDTDQQQNWPRSTVCAVFQPSRYSKMHGLWTNSLAFCRKGLSGSSLSAICPDLPTM